MLNEKLNKYLVPGAILLGFIILTAGLIWGLSAFSFQIGSVDINRLKSDNKYVKQLNSEIQIKSQQLQEQFKNAKTESDKNQIQMEYQQYTAEMDRQFTQKVQEVIKGVAKKKGIKAVANSQSIMYSSVDLTEDVIKVLDK